MAYTNLYSHPFMQSVWIQNRTDGKKWFWKQKPADDNKTMKNYPAGKELKKGLKHML